MRISYVAFSGNFVWKWGKMGLYKIKTKKKKKEKERKEREEKEYVGKRIGRVMII